MIENQRKRQKNITLKAGIVCGLAEILLPNRGILFRDLHYRAVPLQGSLSEAL